jgi:hypothetical protein
MGCLGLEVGGGEGEWVRGHLELPVVASEGSMLEFDDYRGGWIEEVDLELGREQHFRLVLGARGSWMVLGRGVDSTIENIGVQCIVDGRYVGALSGFVTGEGVGRLRV